MQHVPSDKFGVSSPSSPVLAKIKSGVGGSGKRSQGGYERGVKEEAAGRVFENARDAMLYACFNDVGGCFSCGVTLLDTVKGSCGEIGEP